MVFLGGQHPHTHSRAVRMFCLGTPLRPPLRDFCYPILPCLPSFPSGPCPPPPSSPLCLPAILVVVARGQHMVQFDRKSLYDVLNLVRHFSIPFQKKKRRKKENQNQRGRGGGGGGGLGSFSWSQGEPVRRVRRSTEQEK